jgi:hypothetical protein
MFSFQKESTLSGRRGVGDGNKRRAGQMAVVLTVGRKVTSLETVNEKIIIIIGNSSFAVNELSFDWGINIFEYEIKGDEVEAGVEVEHQVEVEVEVEVVEKGEDEGVTVEVLVEVAAEVPAQRDGKEKEIDLSRDPGQTLVTHEGLDLIWAHSLNKHFEIFTIYKFKSFL